MDINHDLNLTCKNLMFSNMFYGLVLLNLQKEWSDKVPTAGVGLNGINYKLYINPEFWKTLNKDQKIGLITHELMHIVFFHLTDYKHLKDADLANIAMDIEINQKIEDKQLPEGGCTLDKFEQYGLLPNEGTNIYYKKLLQEKEKQQQDKGRVGSNGLKDLLENGNTTLNNKDTTLPNHDWGELENLSESEQKLVNRQLAKVLSEVAEQVKKARGAVPHEVEQLIDKYTKIEPPKFNWKAYLRRFIGNSIETTVRKTKRKQSKRFEHDFGIRIHERSHILIGIDSSASVSNEEIMEFLNEIKHMHKTGNQFTIIFADTQMQEPFRYNPKKEIVIKQRGGTDFNPVVDYYHQHRNNFSTLIYLTDGEAPLPDNPVKNMLWVLSERSSPAEHLKASGKVIQLNSILKN